MKFYHFFSRWRQERCELGGASRATTSLQPHEQVSVQASLMLKSKLVVLPEYNAETQTSVFEGETQTVDMRTVAASHSSPLRSLKVKREKYPPLSLE